MRLDKIEIHGFKSFADKTTFDLNAGVTCLVGPNGCGKSNVVDAVKWALGEQRPTALRGDNMADVVFKGNGNRPPMGFAEVTLQFDNSDSTLPIDATEVSISRRLYRNGDSEYLVNRRVCRLKDIRELFVDTGLGQNMYAVLEQGRIDAVLKANPVDRRAVFEEAAGIQKFRMRKREAARKLEKVDQNLLRVADLIEELERRVRSLRIQAGRAKSYVELSDRLTELKTVQFLLAGADMAVRRKQLADDLAAARDLDRQSEVELAEATARVESVESETGVVRESLGRARNRRVEVRAEYDQAQERKATLEQRAQESRTAGEERAAEVARLDEDLATRSEEASTLAAEAAARGEEQAAARRQAEERKAALETAQREAASREETLHGLEERIVGLAERELSLSNDRASLDTEARGLRSARERLVRREAELAGLLERISEESSAVGVELSALDERARERTRSVEESRRELEARRDRELELRREISEKQAALAGKESRRDTLDGVIEKMEGVDEGSRALVKAARDGEGVDGVVGLLGELLPVDRDRARAVDAALGHLAGAVVVRDRAALDRSLGWLRERQAGAATFLVLGSMPSPEAPDADAPGASLVDGIDLEEGDGLAALFRSLLGRARLVDDEADLLANLGSGRFLVTREGARLEASGAFADPPQKRTLGFVERKAERDRLQAEAEALGEDLRKLAEEEARIGAEAAEWTALVAEAEQEIKEIDAGIAEGRSRGERLAERAAIYRRELAVGARERAELERDAGHVRTRRAEVDEALGVARGEREDAESERRREAARREDEADELERLVGEEATAAREVVRLDERVRAVTAELALVKRGLDEQTAVRSRLEAERSALLARSEEAATAAEGLVESIDRLRDEEVEIRDRIVELEAQIERGGGALDLARRGAMAAAEAREKARERLHQLELSERELEMGLSSLRERARDEISLDIEERLAEFDATDVPPLDEVTKELGQVRDKISRIGNVNLDAIHELEEVEQRHEFLTRERGDLDQSRKSLEATIAELDAVSREKFVETFDAVRTHFKTLFRKLFHGGKADVMLQEGVDVLEAGIEIIAGPPGKDPRSITLLSGGERTMTAVGLLFALFKAKPAPVAILDEVDAALDEANIERFCNLLAEFIGKSQFAIVTHSKRTMSYADVIFGVTMEENGVSKRIGIKLDEYEERVA
ncbi:MAG: chromosome segregation protein SMC [Planctomycetota bacterium JB042]